MAFGFSPKFKQEYNLDNLSKSDFLVIAIESAKNLDWNVSFVSENGFIAYTKFSWSSYSEEITVKINDFNSSIKSECTGNQLLDWGKNKKNVEKLISEIDTSKSILTQEEIVTKFSELKDGFSVNEDDVLIKPPSTSKDKITGVFSIFKPTEGYYISPILININIIIFILMLASGVHILSPSSESLLSWGANFKPLTLEGQWWRLFSNIFLHIGVLHLLFNMYALLYIGLLLEPYLGKIRFLAAYLITGIAASLSSLWWHDLSISAGASGAIFGMYGVFLALLTSNLLDKSVKKAMLTSIGVFVAYNILNGLKPNSGIDNAAHIGGLISGLIVGYAFIPSLKNFKNNTIKFSTIATLSILLLITSIIFYNTLPNDIGAYDKKMTRFVEMESMALEIYNMPENTPDDQFLNTIQNRGLYYWKENLKLIESFDEMNLPTQIKERNIVLKEYCELRIKSYKLIYKAIDENTSKYDREINNYTDRIESIITQLTGQK